MICAACSGVPCRRSCSLTAKTRSLLLSLPSFAASPPSSKSNTKTPDSSVRRTSLMPSCSAESRLCKVILSVLGLDGVPSGVELGAWGAAGVEEEEEEEGGAREAQRRSLSTVSCRLVQGRASVERAKLWGTLLMSTLLTCTGMHVSCRSSKPRHQGSNQIKLEKDQSSPVISDPQLEASHLVQ